MLSHAFADLWTILFWLLLGLALGAFLVRVLGSQTTQASGGSRGAPILDGRSATVREDRTLPADQIEAIEGVGPQIGELFHKHGIHRFGQIAAMSPAEIKTLLTAGGGAFAVAQPHTWPFQARLLENGWYAEFLTVGQKLRAGRLPLNGLAGVGDATATRLAAADIGSVEALAALDARAGAAKLTAAGENVSESRLADWIAEARKVASGDFAALAAFLGLPAAVLSARPAAT